MQSLECPNDLFRALIELVSHASAEGHTEEAAALVQALRALRPEFDQLDLFDAISQIRAGDYVQAVRVLRALEGRCDNWTYVQALLAYCLYITGEAQWHAYADAVINAGDDADACDLCTGLKALDSGRGQEMPKPKGEQQVLDAHGLHSALNTEATAHHWHLRAVRG